MKKRPTYSILIAACIGLSTIACGKRDTSTNANTITGANGSANIELRKDQFDGEGTELSGVYAFTFISPKRNCPPGKQSNLMPSTAQYICKQDNSNFKCSNVSIATDTFTGYIGKDGRFLLAFDQKEEKVPGPQGTLAGTINKTNSGQVRYISPNPNEPTIACTTISGLEVQKIGTIGE